MEEEKNGKSKKVILLDNEKQSEVKAALVLHKNSDGQYLCTYHKKTDITEYVGPTSCVEYDENAYIVVGRELSQSSGVYKLTEGQARVLSTNKSDSYFFKYVLNKVLTEGEIDTRYLNKEVYSLIDDLIKKDFELVKPKVEKRDAYLDEKIQQKIKEQEDTKKKAKDARSKKIADYFNTFIDR